MVAVPMSHKMICEALCRSNIPRCVTLFNLSPVDLITQHADSGEYVNCSLS